MPFQHLKCWRLCRKLDIGSTASVGGGLKALGTNINLANILSALDVTASKIENSDVTGAVGGFSVKANGLAEIKQLVMQVALLELIMVHKFKIVMSIISLTS